MKLKEVKVRLSDRPQKTRVYIFEEGENVLDNLANRHRRPYDAYKKEVIPLVKEWLKANKPDVTDLETGDLRWSRKAGCSCGCSPGFISTQFGGKDIYVTISN